MKIRPFELIDESAVVQLWHDCGLLVPWNNPRRDIQRKLKTQPEMFLLACSDERIIATIMAGYDGHRGWVYLVAVSPRHRRRGIGAALMRSVEEGLVEAGCRKLNLQVRATNAGAVGCYERLGYRVEDRVSMGKRLGPVDPPDAP